MWTANISHFSRVGRGSATDICYDIYTHVSQPRLTPASARAPQTSSLPLAQLTQAL